MIKLVEINLYYENVKILLNIYQISSIRCCKHGTYYITMNNGTQYETDFNSMKKLMEVIDNV